MQTPVKGRAMSAGRAATWLALAVAVVGGFEGLRTAAYRDVVGIPTVCFGETRGVHMGDKYTADECRAMLGDGIEEFDKGVQACMTVPLPDKRHVAVVSLAYNIGQRAFCNSTVARKLNAGDVKGGCDAFLMWNKAGGKIIAGLDRRRREERDLCLADGA